MTNEEVFSQLHAARLLVNDGSYARALSLVERWAKEDAQTAEQEAARRLAGCLLLVQGRYAEGLAALEMSRASGVVAHHPPMQYRKTFGALDTAGSLAVGLLECLGLGTSASEIGGNPTRGDSAFYDVATLRTLRLLAKALKKRDATSSKQVQETFRRWVTIGARERPSSIAELRERFAEDGDRAAAALSRDALER